MNWKYLSYCFVLVLIFFHAACEKNIPHVSEDQKLDTSYSYYNDSVLSYLFIDSITISKSFLPPLLGELPDVYFCFGLDTCEDCVNTENQIVMNLQDTDLPITIIPSPEIKFNATDLDAGLNIEAADKDAITGICITEYGSNESLGVLNLPFRDFINLYKNGINSVTAKYDIVFTLFFHLE